MKVIKNLSKLYNKNIIVIIMILFSTSCKKLVEVEIPKTQLTAGDIFKTEATANAALANLYAVSQTWFSGAAGSVTYMCIQLGDETDSYSISTNTQQIVTNQLLPSNTTVTTLWQSFYQTIYQANVMIEALEDNSALTDKFKNQLRGEALFMRGFAHLELTMLYGNIPLVTTSDYRINNTIVQSSQKAVLQGVIADLSKARDLLASDYAITANERIRPNSFAASALLARAYLYDENWEKAEIESTKVIGNFTVYGINTLSDAFLKNNKESILQVKSVSSTFNTNEGNLLILTGKPTVMAIKSSFYNSFETGDLRKTNWIGKVIVGADTYYFPFKYMVKTSTTMSEYSTMLRLAEQYLIRSEALAKQNKLALAIADIDVIRTRAGLQKIATTNPAISQSDLLNQILQERKFELFAEWGHRWIDLKRNGQIDQTMSAIKPTWKSTAALLPIPQGDIKINFNLSQNPGY